VRFTWKVLVKMLCVHVFVLRFREGKRKTGKLQRQGHA